MRLLLPCLAYAALSASSAGAYTIEDFTPQGEAGSVRQVTARFSEPMVAFGDPTGGPLPFLNSCEERGSGRWVDPTTWVFDFKADLPAGVSCQLTLAPGLKSLKDTSLSGGATFAFSTGGPEILDSAPYRWSVPEDGAFILKLNSDYDASSLTQHAWFQVAGVASRIPLGLVTGAARDEILAAEYRYQEGLKAADLARTVIVRPQTHLPPGKTVQLVFGPGVATAKGVARTKAQTWDYEVRPAFKATFECERENAKADCIPITDMRVSFSGEVARELAAQARLVAQIAGKRQEWQPTIGADEAYVYGLTFKGPFPEKTKMTLTLPDTLKDDAGRAPVNRKSFPLQVRTAGYPPLVKFAANFGIIEATGKPMLPVTVRNVEAELKARVYAPVERAADKSLVKRWYDRLKSRLFRIPREDGSRVLGWLDKLSRVDREQSAFQGGKADDGFDPGTTVGGGAKGLAEVKLARKDGKAFEVMGLPLDGPGFYVVETESRVLGEALLDKQQPMYVAAAALVTNLAVHFKRGDAGSLVWVTSLDRGRPVDGALVSVWDCARTRHFTGRTDKRGVVRIDAPLPDDDKLPTCFKGGPYGKGLLVAAELGDDFSFVHTSWDEGIEPWRFNLPYVEAHSDVAMHTVFDRTLFRAGETVHMKTVARARSLAGFAQLPKDKRPKKLHLVHEGSDQKYEIDVAFDDQGVAACDWAVPADAHLGTYRAYVVMGAEDAWENQVTTGEFRVEEFRIPLAKGLIDGGGRILVAPAKAKFDLGVQYLSGGAAANQPVTFRVRALDRTTVEFPGYDGYQFLTAPVKAGVTRRDAAPRQPRELVHSDLTLDHAGTASVTVDDLPQQAAPFELESELEYKDPAGEVQTVAHRQVIWPARVALGLKPDGWALSKKDVRAKIVALSRDGKPVPGVAVSVRMFRKQTLSHRKRLVGGFYAYESSEKVTPVGKLCDGTTGSNGELLCSGPATVSGQVVLEAYASVDGHDVTASESVYVAGKDDWYFAQENHDRMDVVPEKKSYEPGEKARIQVRMPFRRGIALVTVEREGVSDVYVKKLSGKAPVLEIPMKDEYAPNAYVSVLVVRGRVAKPEPGFLVDLGKPAFRLGVAPVQVGIRPFQLNVRVSTDHKVYQARQDVEATIEATTPDGMPPTDAAEAAVAVVDEGLLELRPNDSWSLLQKMTGSRPDRVRTFSAALQVVGKRHFGLKALAAGGGGGTEVSRSLFDPLVFWQSRVPLDGKGRATVRFKLNDSLTSFKIVAIAQAGVARFGTGGAQITSTKDVMVLPGVPPVARAGDVFKAGFTLRNTTKDAKELTATLTADGVKIDGGPQTVKLAGNKAQEIAWTVTAPAGRDGVEYTVDVQAGGRTLDKVTAKQKLSPALPERSIQASLTQLDGSLDLAVERPTAALPGRGGVTVALKRTLAGGPAGLTAYMRDYPYSCLEQKASRAVALADDEAWRLTMASLPAYLDGAGFAKYYPTSEEGSPALTAYLLTLAAESGRALPDDALSRMQAALTGFVDGSVQRHGVSFGADLVLQKLAAIDALSRYKQATAAMITTFEHQPEQWPTSALVDWIGILHRVAEIPEAAALQKDAVQRLRTRLTYRGTELQFSTEERDRLWWLMTSPDVNAVRTLLVALELNLWEKDLPKLAKGVLARTGRNGHWDLTTANALGAVALGKFAKRFETEAVKGTTVATLAGKTASQAWSDHPDGGELRFAWPDAAATLHVEQDGKGKPWVSFVSRAALPLTAPVASGFTVKRSVKPVRVKQPGSLHVGDVLRIRLDVDTQADTGFVVVDDPIPAGATILGGGLGRNGTVPGEPEKDAGEAWPIYRELSLSGLRAYYDTVPKGPFTVEYTVRLNNAGTFHLPPTRVEAMYAPDTYGETPNADLTVQD